MARTFLSCLLALFPLVWSSGVRPTVVCGTSMRPALRPGQLVLLDRSYYGRNPLRCGDVVVFRWKGDLYVKRIYALPGQEVRLWFDADSDWSIPIGKDVEARVRRLKHRPPGYEVRRLIVPPQYIYALGDNLGGSIDSRALGPVPISAIVGRVTSMWGSPLPPREATMAGL